MKKRKDSFWGIHSDFHAKPEFGAVGRNFNEEDVREICRTLRPDYWQVDCKGHPGWASYPSALGNGMPDFACDILEKFRRITREEGVALYVHYSGVIDYKYCRENPDQRVIQADGTPFSDITRRTGKYADELLIPQLLEVAEKYGVDGAWVDGDCWGSNMDYHPETVAAFERKTGIDLGGELPKKRGDQHFEEYREFNREMFREFVRHYVDAVHEKFPDFQITSNWMFSDHMPEAITANVDYLSGDLFPWNSVNWARYAGRAMAQQDHPWDLMAWTARGAMRDHLDFLPVHPTQLIQEAAAVIAMGGGFQQVTGQLLDGSPDMEYLRSLKPLSEFVRAREPYCFRGKPIHQVAMLLSTHDRQMESEGLFVRGNCDGKIGLTALLCDIGQSLEIVSEHKLPERVTDCPVLVVPELHVGLETETINELLRYAEQGGSLVLVGVNTCRVFAEAGAPFAVTEVQDELLSVDRVCQSNATDSQRFFTLNNKEYGAIFHPVEIVADDAEVVANTCYQYTTPRHPFASVIPYGKGKIAAIGGNLGTEYNREMQYTHRHLMRAICERMYTPMVRVEATCGVLEIVCLQKDGRLMLQLVNGNGHHTSMSCATEEFVPPVLDVTLSIALSKAPDKMVLQPEGKELPFVYRDGRAFVDVDRVNMHEILEVIM